jgi:hypothetical protein
MAKTLEHTDQRLTMQFRPNTLVLDKAAGTATLQRKILFWSAKPIEKPLADITDVTIDKAVDRASGVEVYHAMLVMQTGDAWALAENDKKSVEATASTIRQFLGVKSTSG